ncbi:hypothetical protein BYT27DRAFT_7237980 [Phlegmacium glaucopus]|nr:hypothetical protein BYT27DRAFT_7237980 [Phlegmacium glaucopus]
MTNLVEEFIDCPVLEDVWHKMSKEDQLSCMQELKDQLRALTPPDPERVQSVNGSGCHDVRLHFDGLWGPYANHHEFQTNLGYELVRNTPDRFPEACEPLAKNQGRKWRNMKEKRIAAIIDWESSGWLPEYWDYCRVGSVVAFRSPPWWDLFNEVMDTYPDEFAVE